MATDHISLTTLSNLQQDFRAEVIAAELVAGGHSAERILIQQTGGQKRSLRKDVDAIQEAVSDYDHKEHTVIQTPRDGLYDLLPEGIFHHAATHRATDSEQEIIKSIKKRKQQELDARRFFLPFEATVNYLRMQMAMYENRLDKRTVYDELANVFYDEWEIFRHLDARQADIFVHLIPILHDIRDNHPVIQTIMGLIFHLPVNISLRSQLPLSPETPIVSELGDSALGVDFSTGNATFTGGVDEIIVRIGPVSAEVFQQFLPGKKDHSILELLYDYLLPVHITDPSVGKKPKKNNPFILDLEAACQRHGLVTGNGWKKPWDPLHVQLYENTDKKKVEKGERPPFPKARLVLFPAFLRLNPPPAYLPPRSIDNLLAGERFQLQSNFSYSAVKRGVSFDLSK